MRGMTSVLLVVVAGLAVPGHGQEPPGTDGRQPAVDSGTHETVTEAPFPICWDEPWRQGLFGLEPATGTSASPGPETVPALDAGGETAAQEADRTDGGGSWRWWVLGGGALAALATILGLLAWWRGRSGRAARGGDRDALESLIEAAVERRLKALTSRQQSVAPQRRQQNFEQRVAAHEQHLERVARRLSEQLRQGSAALCEELRGALRHEAQSLSEGLRHDLGGAPLAPPGGNGASPVRRLGSELAELTGDERRPLTAFEAAGRLGDWIDRLWPALQDAAGLDVESIAGSLPEPAAAEWCQATRTLKAFSGPEAAAFRRLDRWASGAATSDRPPEPLELAFLEETGLLAGERPLAERLRRYLEPFDHLGRLGEITLALQYLLEAFPIEQLSKDQRSQIRHGLSQADLGADGDFHLLVARIAGGVGLRYRPVRYYKSRTDQSDCAFVRQQVSPISLSERVGFEATADKATIVRLGRPFFFQLDTGIYYAGHAHVARG